MPPWYYIVGAVLVVLLVVLYPLQGWITWAVKQRRRERFLPTVPAPQHPAPKTWADDRLTVSWLGHATVLMNFHGVGVITDPVFGNSIGLHLPGGVTFGPRRLAQCALQPAELPPLNLILQSHAHLDHLDTRSWKRIGTGPAVIMAAGTARYVRGLGFTPVTELDWGQSVAVDGLRVTAVPVQHWGERFPWNRDRHGYNAYLLERAGRAVLFGGDTAATDSFAEVCRGRRVDLAILPIGGYQPYIHSHASPEQAWDMFRAIEARHLAAIHHQTFVLSNEPPDEPLQRLLACAGSQINRVVLRDIGSTFVVPEP